MTTEVLRALLYGGPRRSEPHGASGSILDGLDVIVLDEFHYLQDPDRGPVWEEVVIHSPAGTTLVCLSATLPDLDVVHQWLERTHGPTELVVEDQRPVTLQFLYAVGNLQGLPPLVLPMFLERGMGDLKATLDDRLERRSVFDAPGGCDRPRIEEAAPADGRCSTLSDAVGALRVGDVVVDPGRASVGRLVVVAPPRTRRGQTAVDTVGADNRRVVMPAGNFRMPPVVVASIDLSDLAPGMRGFASRAAARLRQLPDTGQPPAAPPPQRRREQSMAVQRQRLDDEIEAIRRRMEDETSAHDLEFDAVADLLRRRGHLDGWALTASGAIVRRLFHERGLLVAECLVAGIFDGLDAPSLAAAVSAFRSGASQELTPTPFPTSELRDRWRRIDGVILDLQRCQAGAGVPMTPPPDAALIAPLYRWVAGCDLGPTLQGTILGPGDLVREARQVLELLEQVAAVAPPALAACAHEVIALTSRGVVVATAHPEQRFEPV